MKKVAVVILNWNGKSFLQKFLPTVVQFNPEYAEVVVADNASKDDSIEFLKNNYPAIRLIQFPENSGFAKGYNDALKQIEAEYFVVLNSDVEVTPHWIEPIIELMDSDKNIAVCQPKIISYHQRTHFEYAGAAGGFIDKYGYPFCRGRIFDAIEEDKGQYNDAIEIFWATGACMFVRASVFHEVGGFDEEFFAHMEEIDLCWRIRNHGYKIFFSPQSKIFHIGGGTLPKNNPRKTYLNFRNNIMLLYKNAPANQLLQLFLLRFILDGMAGIKFLFTDSFPDCWAVVKAHFYFYSNYFRLRKKRKSTQRNIVTHHTALIYKGNIAVDYFLKKKKKFSELKWIK